MFKTLTHLHLEGFVIKSTGSWYQVQTEEGLVEARIRGKFRNDNIESTNPVAVGDEVTLEVDQDDYVISEIHERRNYIIRKSINLSKRSQIIAANIDHAYLIVTITSPETLLGFVDRFLVTAEAYHIPASLLFNKVDLYDDEAMKKLDKWEEIYKSIGYECHRISGLEKQNIAFLKDEIKEKKVLISGNSGVGKSTLINALDPKLSIKTGVISDAHNSGQHTTTFAEMHSLDSGGYIIDTPGIRGFGIVDIDKTELSHYFPEMRAVLNDCKFNNCIHVNEPGCAVQKAAGEGKIPFSRYENYLAMVEEDQSEIYRKNIYG